MNQESTEPDAPSTSADRFVDALLSHRLEETPLSRERRIDHVMRSVRGAPSSSHAIRGGWRWWALPIAAIVAVSFLVLPTASSAAALLRSAARVARLPIDRRYEIVMVPVARRDGDSPPPICATLDIRDADHLRVTIRFPDGHSIERGRDGATSWDRAADGAVLITDGSKPWPRWIETPDGSLLIDSVASMLDGLDTAFDLTRVENAQCHGQGQVQGQGEFVQIDAKRKGSSSARHAPQSAHPQPDRVVMCLDPISNEVIRLEMQFARQIPPPDGERGPPPDGQRGPPPDGQRGPPPDGERGPPPDGERGPPPDGERGPPPDGERGPRRMGERRPAGPPQSITFSREPLNPFPPKWFSAPESK